MSFAAASVAARVRARVQQMKVTREAREKYIAGFNGSETCKVTVVCNGIISGLLRVSFISHKDKPNSADSIFPFKGSRVTLYSGDREVIYFTPSVDCTLEVKEIPKLFIFRQVVAKLV